MWSWLIPAAASLIGGIFSHKGNQQAQNQELANQRAAQYNQWLAGKGPYEHTAAGQAYRSQLVQQMMAKWFPNVKFSPDVMAKLTTPTAYPEFNFVPGLVPQNNAQWIGGALEGIAPYLNNPYRQPMPTSGLNLTGGSTLGNPAATAYSQYLQRYYPASAAAVQGQTYGPTIPADLLSTLAD